MKLNNPKSKSFGLVIQGRIESDLRTYNQKYNSNDAIQYNIRNYGKLFKKIVYCTWPSEKDNIKLNNVDLQNVDLLFVNDPGQPILYSGDTSDNRLRINYASLKGVEHIKNQVDYIVKIRADLKIDLSKCINFFLKEIDRKKNILKDDFRGLVCGFEFWLNRPYALKDLLYIGTSIEINNFFLAQVEYKNQRFAPLHNRDWPEGDSVRKYLYFNKKNLNQFKEENFFSITPKKLKWSNAVYYEDEFELWQFALKNYFSALPKNIKTTCEFKGRKYGDFDTNFFEGDDHEIYIKAEENYLRLLKDISNETKSFMILKKSNFRFNPNFVKRKVENLFKKKNIITRITKHILELYIQYRKFLHLISRRRLIKRIILIFRNN